MRLDIWFVTFFLLEGNEMAVTKKVACPEAKVLLDMALQKLPHLMFSKVEVLVTNGEQLGNKIIIGAIRHNVRGTKKYLFIARSSKIHTFLMKLRNA